jgi:CHASE2 domain-containing sensor protein/tRNA A-37 threonylcarbamoyl transferase component Bud32
MLFKKIHLSTLLLVAAIIAVILGNILYDFDILQPLEYKVYDSVARLRQRKAATEVVVLAIDDHSIQQLGSWPWPRSYLADMIKLLSDSGTRAMGISLLYPTRELNPGLQELKHIKEVLNDKPTKAGRKITTKINSLLKEAGKRLDHDAQLMSAVRSAQNVVLPVRFSLGSPGDGSSPKLSKWLNLNSIELSSTPQTQNTLSMDSIRQRGMFNNHRIQASRITQPYLDLSKKAGALGHINLIGDQDGIVRKIPLLITYQDRDFVSFALQVARKYSGGKLKEITVVQDKIVLRHLQIPTGKNHRMLIDYSGQDVNIQQISFVDVINGKVDPKTFRKKVVLLGVTAEGLSQQYNTPTGSNVSGLEIEAAAIENIINAQYISRPSWVHLAEILALMYFGFFLLFVIPRVSPRLGALILGIFLSTWVGASVIIFISNGIWIKVLAPVVFSAIGFALANLRRDMTEKQDENVELNKSLGLALQGQGMLDMAYDKFLKCPVENKAVQQLLYNLGLDFERKRMTNKALSVYRHIMKAGAFKDIKERINRLISLDSTMSMTAAAAKKETSFLLQNGAAKPTLGRYEILKELGQGAMGIVYLGRDPSINREVAVKTISYADIAPDELDEVKARFFREAEAAGKLSHPNIVTIYDMGEDHDMAYIAMELLKGKELTHFCQKNQLMPVKRVLNVVSAVAQALGYAHSQQVVHRDIKPANILHLDDNQIKVADFGIARVISSSKTQTGIIFGTPNYMSPEQVAGKKVDGRSDLFSLGVVFYELLSGARPFKGDNMTALLYAVAKTDYVSLAEIAPKVPSCCVKVVERLLAKGVSQRYQSASQVIKNLQSCLDTLS